MRRRRELALQQLTTRGGRALIIRSSGAGAPKHAVTLEPSTRDRYANVYKCHIWRPLGELPLGELTVTQLRVWQAELVKARVNAGTIDKSRTLLSSVLHHAAGE